MPGKFDSRLLLWDAAGSRKYLTLDERLRFLRASGREAAETELFCQVLAKTGARISEALELTPERLDTGTWAIVFRTLKRRKLSFRPVPVPARLLRDLAARSAATPPNAPIWPWCRQTAWSRVKAVMKAAEIEGPQATPKGLRHGFGLACAEKNIPLGTIAKWMGHSSIETTMIYLDALGQEERQFAERLWRDYAGL